MPVFFRTRAVLLALAILAIATALYLRTPNRLGTQATASPAVAPATAAGRVPRDLHEWVQRIVQTLAAREAPESLAAAALLIESNAVDFSSSAANRTRVDLTRRAAASAPNDPAIQWLALRACRAVYDCDGAVYENALATLDPSNAWTSTPALRHSVAAGNQARQAEILAHMARAQRFDSYLARMEALLDHALRSLDIPPPSDAELDGTQPTSRLVSQTLNMSGSGETFSEVAQACKASSQESVTQDCRAIAKLMLNSDEDRVVRSGLELASTLYRADSPEAAQIAHLQRRYDWQMYQAIRLPRSPEQDARFVKGRLGDAELRRQLLEAGGIALEPPADWVNPFGPTH